MANTRHDRTGGKSARPRRGPQAKMGARERIATERAARKRAEARRRFLTAIAAAGAVLAVVVTLVAVKLTSNPVRPVASESQASSVVVRQVTTVPAAVLTRVSPGQEITPLQTVKTSGPPLTIGGKPAIVFVSEESCPFCAAERWSLTVALSHFGTWSHLGSTTSSATDVYPNTATLSFRTAVYHSTELTLRTTELADNAGRSAAGPEPAGHQAHRRLRRAPLREQRRPVRGGPVPRHRQSVHPGRRAVRPAGPRGPVGGPDCQPAQQPVEPGGPGYRRVSAGHHRSPRPGPARQVGPATSTGRIRRLKPGGACLPRRRSSRRGIRRRPIELSDLQELGGAEGI